MNNEDAAAGAGAGESGSAPGTNGGIYGADDAARRENADGDGVYASAEGAAGSGADGDAGRAADAVAELMPSGCTLYAVAGAGADDIVSATAEGADDTSRVEGVGGRSHIVTLL